MTAYNWVQNDHETVETDLNTLDGAPSGLDLTGRTVHFVLRHYTGAKVADKEASVSGTTATVELTPANLSRPSSHEAEWVITDGSDDPTTLPKDEPIDVDVRPSVDDDDNVAEPLPEDAEVDILTANGFDGSITGDSLVESLVDANLAVDANGNLFAPESASQLTDEEVQDIVGAFVSGGTKATVTYDDSANELVVSATDTQLTNEEVQDIVGAFVSGGTNVTVSYDDSNDALVVSADHDHSGDTLGTDSSPVTTAHVATTDTEELSVTETYLGRLANTPTDSEIGTDNVALYFKDGDDTLYKRPYGGTETSIGGESSPWSDSDSNNLYEQDLGGIEVPQAKTDELALNAHEVFIQSTAPSAPSDGDIWFDLP